MRFLDFEACFSLKGIFKARLRGRFYSTNHILFKKLSCHLRYCCWVLAALSIPILLLGTLTLCTLPRQYCFEKLLMLKKKKSVPTSGLNEIWFETYNWIIKLNLKWNNLVHFESKCFKNKKSLKPVLLHNHTCIITIMQFSLLVMSYRYR